MDKNFLLDLCNRINLGREEIQCVINTLNLEFTKVAAIVKKCSMMPVNSVLRSAAEHERNYRKGAALCLACVIACCERTYGIYKEKGIPDEVFYDTMGDISIWAENFKNKYGPLQPCLRQWRRKLAAPNNYKAKPCNCAEGELTDEKLLRGS